MAHDVHNVSILCNFHLHHLHNTVSFNFSQLSIHTNLTIFFVSSNMLKSKSFCELTHYCYAHIIKLYLRWQSVLIYIHNMR